MNNKNSNNNNYSKWKTKVDEYRGYVRGILEEMRTDVQEIKNKQLSHDGDIQELKIYMESHKAIAKKKGILWGFIGSIFGSVIIFIVCHFLLGLFGGK